MCANEDFDLRLIELVRIHPRLYDPSLRTMPYDAHKKKKTEFWCNIASTLRTDVCTCITRWNHLKERLRREMLRDHSDWTLLPKLHFLPQFKHGHHLHSNEHIANTVGPSSSTNWRALSPGELIEEVHDLDDPLQEAMDEQHVGVAAAVPDAEAPVINGDVLKRMEVLLQGLGPNRAKAEKKILAYLCKCNLRALNAESIDDISI
ncbi:CG6683 [Drosophila busckii]|uniref:CG6683 n=1 Tax=Drosophila busckii TaxID=30019 RepID=A0A0M3QVW3_DROBS|nr:uncharacterized protein LOC108598437 [Drosophila busckii]ALC43103.1 CG6683 [Drosophila busckii]